MGVTIRLAGDDPDLWVKEMQDPLEGECRVLPRLKNRRVAEGDKSPSYSWHQDRRPAKPGPATCGPPFTKEGDNSR